MIRLLAAFAWLRWRTFWNTLRGGSKRDTMEAASRILVAGVGIMMAVIGVPVALGLGVFGFVAGWNAARAPDTAQVWLAGVRIVLLIPVFGILVGPLVQGAQGATIYSRYLLLPIPRRVLWVLEISTHALDPWVLLFVPALLLFPAGVAGSGRPGAAAWILPACVLYLALLATAGAAITHVIQAAFRGRRQREWLAVVVMMVMSSMGALPALIEHGSRGGVRRPDAPAEAASGAPVWLRAMPSDLVAGTAAAAFGGRAAGVAGRLAVLAGAVLLFGGVSAGAFGRVIEPPSGTSRRRRAGAPAARRGLSFVNSPSGVVAETVVRLVFRSVRGKIIVLSSPIVIGVMGVVLGSNREVPRLLGTGPLLYLLGGVFATLSLQPVFLNQFSIERHGLARTFLAPLSDLDIVRGKSLGVLALATAMAAMTLAVAAWFPPGQDPRLWIAALPVPLAVIWLLSPLASVLSAVFPVTTDLDRTGSRGGNAHTVSGIAAMMLFPLAYAAFLGPAFAMWRWTGSAHAAAATTFGLSAAAAVAAMPLHRVAAATLGKRRDNVLLVASGR